MLAMLLSGTVIGAVNGLVYVFGRLPHPFIITLATLSICRGLALEFSIGHTTMRGMPDAIAALGGSSFFGVPNSFFVVLGVVLVAVVLTRYMVWGRWLYAVGGDPQAARGMGIPVRGGLVSAYMISGLCAGIGAILLSGRTGASSPLYGDLLELDTIAAVIIGGASFLGGRGHIGHALVGALIGVIPMLSTCSMSMSFQMIAIGVIIVVAVEADVLRNRLEAQARALQSTRLQWNPGAAPSFLCIINESASSNRGAQDVSSGIKGEVLALLGDNGAGKSHSSNYQRLHVLMVGNTIDGKRAALGSPAAAQRAGIETVYQTLRFSTT
jgi:ribose transport system permease protein